MRINLGSGWRYREGWVNVDLYADRADVREDLRTVQFPAGTVTEILASHVIEHFVRKEGVQIVEHCFDWLAPGGTLVVEMPNRTRCIELAKHSERRRQINGLKGLIGGRDGDKEAWHAWMQAHADKIIERAERAKTSEPIVPAEWQQPGTAHLYVWDAEEFRAECEQIGYVARVEKAVEHGERYGRDFRVVGVKP